MKKCPFCSEDILEDAKKCKHCGEWLDRKFHFDCEVLDCGGQLLNCGIDASSQAEVEKQVREKCWKLITICKDGEKKQVIDEEYVRESQRKKAKMQNIVFLVIAGIVVTFLILVAMTDSGSNYSYDHREVEDIAKTHGLSNGEVTGMMAAIEKGMKEQ